MSCIYGDFLSALSAVETLPAADLKAMEVAITITTVTESVPTAESGQALQTSNSILTSSH